MEAAGRFLDAWARSAVPACDPAVVHSVFETASAGHGVARRRDGRRASVITPSGVPFEASVTGGGGRPSDALRYVTEAGSSSPFFRPRLAAQTAALRRLCGRLPHGEASTVAEAELPCFVDTLFPDPSAVPARIRFATWFGLVHRPEVPEHLACLKVYGVLFDGQAGLDRLAARWPAFRELSDLVTGVRALRPYMADLEVDATGVTRCKLYTLSAGGRAPFETLARRCHAELNEVEAELARADAAVHSWSRVFFCCGAAEPADGSTSSNGSDGPGAELSVHLPVKALVVDGGGVGALTRRLAEAHHGDSTALDALEGAAARTQAQWDYTFAGVGLAPAGHVGKVNLYYAPADGPER